MQPTGYSQRPLAAKLGLKSGMRVRLIGAPADYLEALGAVVAQVEFDDSATSELDFIQVFAIHQSALMGSLPAQVSALAPNGALWLCWPKLSAKVPTDLREQAVREAGLAAGLVDVKVAAIDTMWSGLKFVIRLQDRPRETESTMA
ncbi:MAG TPA: hypothetical protein VF792_09905 [Ktedonobacterales bacterium]